MNVCRLCRFLRFLINIYVFFVDDISVFGLAVNTDVIS